MTRSCHKLNSVWEWWLTFDTCRGSESSVGLGGLIPSGRSGIISFLSQVLPCGQRWARGEAGGQGRGKRTCGPVQTISRDHSRAFGLQPECRGSFVWERVWKWTTGGCLVTESQLGLCQDWGLHSVSSVTVSWVYLRIYVLPLAAVRLQWQSWAVGVRLCDHRIRTSTMCFLENFCHSLTWENYFASLKYKFLPVLDLRNEAAEPSLVQLKFILCSVYWTLWPSCIQCLIFPIGLHQNVLPKRILPVPTLWT